MNNKYSEMLIPGSKRLINRMKAHLADEYDVDLTSEEIDDFSTTYDETTDESYSDNKGYKPE